MLRLLVIVSALICNVIALPATSDTNLYKNPKKGKYYKLDQIVGGSNSNLDASTIINANDQLLNPISNLQQEYSEDLHVRQSPQDPFESAEPVPNDFTATNYNHYQQRQPLHNQKSITTTSTTTRKPLRIHYDDQLQKHQAESAQYSFDSSIQDNINDQSHIRKEVRDGLKVTGMYEYSDGFFHRTVHYVADENGYRIVKEEVQKIGEGPQFNSGGRADVQGSLIGGYSIQIDDRERNPHYVGINQKP